MWARKAPYHYGWDWGPRFVTSGIWRPVALEAWDEARLDDVQVFQNKLEAGKARELGDRRARGRRRAPGTRASTVAQPGGPTLGHADVALKPGVNDVKLGARIDKPELWWPTGLGAAAALHAGDDAGDGRRQGARRAHDAHRPADDRGRPRARRRGQELLHQGQRRARVHEGRQLDPRRQLRHARDRRTLPLPAAVGRRREHEHAARLGRRHLRGRSLLRALRRAGPAGVAGLHVRLQHVPGRRALRRERPPARRSRTSAACATTPAWRCGRATTRTRRPGSSGAGRSKFALRQEGAGPHLGRLQARVPRGAARGRRRRGSGALLHAQLAQRERRQGAAQQARTGATCTSGACGTPRTRTRRTPTTSRAS